MDLQGKLIVIATLIAGTLDIASAIITALLRGKPVARMLQGVASGPFGRWPIEAGWAGAAAGLAVHFAIMAAMAAAFVLAAAHLPGLQRLRLVYGAAYGALLYGFMYWVVLPLRWPGAGGVGSGIGSVLLPLGIHILLVGIPIALTATASVRSSRVAV
ncbi:CHASE2 domain-containing sensor protein [Sphingomonas naasensis]|uniref:DUF2938 family protein n=1 Tax=Sphingomonas naasensis TaxID=1344951 RepID=A0A4S1WEV4_9SPHN|nr:hypothetical protein [Sphingomonas naasensis]NIJ21477.1 CHASE2 domain-containing sensor protein [Sphingomonas naasensis]TGX41568.1 hypothetical protein E5A74_13210 [Sphingomonas naasensis]